MELKLTFDHLADVIISRGTAAVRDELEALAARVRPAQPGAAEALTDWEGEEIARERAFAVIRNEQLRAEALEQLHATQAASAARGVALFH
ncbi:hypothetical protein [Demequina sp. NBRC 110056]|uniref:hypothetical protein n=1 Tax=Demequina sp. NBRC 110056 TaxID=1570345 RepID=UPI000A076103|nr:hypothetical protein [Demequina sp. NBRC 110056]